jgi:pentatricopeptide repeat protein
VRTNNGSSTPLSSTDKTLVGGGGTYSSRSLTKVDEDNNKNKRLHKKCDVERKTSSSSSSSLVQSFRHVRNAVNQQLRDENDFAGAKMLLGGMIDYLQDSCCCGLDVDNSRVSETTTMMLPNNSNFTTSSASMISSSEEHRTISETIDDAFQIYYVRAFAPPFRNELDWQRTNLGIEVLQLQLKSSDVLVSPYDTVPKRVIVQALTAITSFQGRQRQEIAIETNVTGRRHDKQQQQQQSPDGGVYPDVAFRLLQRLVTGVGVRNHSFDETKSKYRQRVLSPLYEVDFNRVLNVYSNLGHMDMAHRVIALQERTRHAPSLSSVTYSILVKGYGKLGDWNNIDLLLRHAAASKIAPDTILFNSLMDAYINCDQLEKAQRVFDAMVYRQSTNEHDEYDFEFPFGPEVCPPPNLRSYNTLLKGLAQKGRWYDAKKLSMEMKHKLGMWDHVTTNTLVRAAVEAGDFDSAEDILKECTSVAEKGYNSKHHLNADAYTTLIDGYAKNRHLDKALSLFQAMKARNVEPNEFHYSSLIGGLARHGKVEQAHKLLSHVNTVGISSIRQRAIYNAFISGLIHEDGVRADGSYDQYIDQALLVLRDMIGARIFPDVNTMAIILDGFSHCLIPRVVEATTLIEKLETQNIIPRNDKKVYTALVRVHATANDLKGAVDCFRRIKRPDTPAINALMDAAIRCGKDQAAMDAFKRYFGDGGHRPQAIPDVISYSTLIGALLRKGTLDGARSARALYEEMRYRRRIFPDKVLVDM